MQPFGYPVGTNTPLNGFESLREVIVIARLPKAKFKVLAMTSPRHSLFLLLAACACLYGPGNLVANGQSGEAPASADDSPDDDDVSCSVENCRNTRLPSVFLEPEVCQYDQPAQRGGALVAGMFDLHTKFDGRQYSCPARNFQGWDAVVNTQAFLYARELAIQNLGSSVRQLSQLLMDRFNATLDELLGFNIRDTCSSSLLSTVHTINLTLDAIPEATTGDTCTPRVQIFIGPASSSEVASISQILSAKNIPQISFWASSSTFDDTFEYPYLFRTVPSDTHQVKALVDLIEHFGWTYIAVVASIDSLYGQSGLESLRREISERSWKNLDNNMICIGQEHSISHLELNHTRAIIKQLRHDPQIKVIVVFAQLADATSFLQLMVRESYTDVVLLGSEDWINRLDFNSQFPPSKMEAMNAKLPPVFGFAPRPLQREYLDRVTDNMARIFQDPERLAPYWAANPWLKLYLENSLQCHLDGPSSRWCGNRRRFQRNCSDDEVFLETVPNLLASQPLLQAVSLAMTAMLMSIGNSSANIRRGRPQTCINTGGIEVRCLLSNLAVPCDDVVALVPDQHKVFSDDPNETPHCLLFDSCTQSALPFYYLLNLHLNTSGSPSLAMEKLGSWNGFPYRFEERLTMNSDGRIDWKVNGNLSSSGNVSAVPNSTCVEECSTGHISVMDELLPCCFFCEPCPNQTVSTMGTCTECDPGMMPNKLLSACIEIPGEYIGLTSSYGMFILVEACLGMVCLLFTVIVIWKYRESPHIKACDIHLSVVMLLAGQLAFISAIIALRQPSNTQCRLILLFSSPWTLICSATVLAKTNRLQRLFNASAFIQLKLLSTPVQIVLVALLAFIGEAIAIAAVTISNPDVERLLVNRNTVQLVCRSSKFTPWYGSIVAYNILLIGVCLVVAFRVRKLPERYNEARLIFMASFCTFMVWLGLGPAFFITTGRLQPFIVALANSAQIWSLWACLFSPRLYQVLSPKAKAKSRRARYGRSTTSTFDHSSRQADKSYSRSSEHSARMRRSKFSSIGSSATVISDCGSEMLAVSPKSSVTSHSADGLLPSMPEDSTVADDTVSFHIAEALSTCSTLANGGLVDDDTEAVDSQSPVVTVHIV